MNQDNASSSVPKKADKRKFINDKYLSGYTKPKMIDAATELLCTEDLSEEGFLGAQAVLLLNGILK